MPLTDSAISKVKPQFKTQKLFDGGGLFLEVTPTGSKRWRLKYRFAGKEKLLSLGIYPEIGLRAARTRREELRSLIAMRSTPASIERP